MKRRLLPVIAVLVIALLAVWWWKRDTAKPAVTASSSTSRGSAAGGGAITVQHQQLFSKDRPVPKWFTRGSTQQRRIAGKVTLDGKPVAGAAVTLQNTLTHAGVGSAVEVKSGADGRFDLGQWPVGGYLLSASQPDTQTAIKALDLFNPTVVTEDIELKLRGCTLRVSGTVTDASNAPIADAVVRRDGVIVARSTPKGVYSVCLGYGEVDLDYSADGYGAIVLGMNLLGSRKQDVVLVPEVVITGKVVRASDGSPVPDALVNAFPAQWGRDRAGARPAVTDPSGAFRIEGLTPGKFRLWAYAEGLGAESAPEVQAEVGVPNDVTIKLVERATVAGIVTRADKPLPNVMVQAIRKSPAARSNPAWTQSDGTFVIHDAAVGDLVFTVEGYDVTAPAVVKVENATRVDGVKIQVALMAKIHGTVTRNGVPVEGVNVWGAGNEGTKSDASGHYEFVGLPPGTYQLGAGSDDVGAFTIGPKVTVAAGEEKRVDLEMELAGEIAGTVVDAGGKPVEGVFVRWTHSTTQDEGRATTDAQGHYRCRAMSGGGTYTAKVYPSPETPKPFPPAPGSSYPSREVKDGASKVEGVVIAIDLKQMTITGRVVDAAGAAVADAQVKAMPHEGTGPVHFNSWMKLPTAVTDTDGTFTLRELLPGNYALQARSTDDAEQIVPGIAAGATGVTIKLTRPGGIDGTLVGFTQTAVIYATPWNAPNKLYPGTVDGAKFTVTGIPPGRYIVNGQNMYEGDAKSVEIRANERAAVTLTAKGRGVIVGRVLDFKTKKPLVGSICRAVMSVDGQQGLTNWDHASAPKSDETGRVLFDPAPAGYVTVTCINANNRQSQPAADVNVPPGGRVEVDLYSVLLTAENPGMTGALFHWQVTPPRIGEVVPNSSAAKAGLQGGDLVVAVDGASVEGLNGIGVSFLIEGRPLGSTASVTYQRGSVRKTVPLQVQQGP